MTVQSVPVATGSYLLLPKGRALVVACPSVIERMRRHPRITILTESDFGDGVVICLVETDFIAESYRGVCDAVTVGEDFKFTRDADI